jgi:hypothetical protein
MGLYRDWIAELKRKWVKKKVIYEGKKYTVVDVDYNGGLLIDKRNRYNDTTAVPEESVTEVMV